MDAANFPQVASPRASPNQRAALRAGDPEVEHKARCGGDPGGATPDGDYGSKTRRAVQAWHHYALVWRAGGIPGVDNGQRKVAAYLDGALDTAKWHAAGPFKAITGGKTFTYTGSATTFAVPSCAASLTIAAWGAEAGMKGSKGGRGAWMRGSFSGLGGAPLLIAAGGGGGSYCSGNLTGSAPGNRAGHGEVKLSW